MGVFSVVWKILPEKRQVCLNVFGDFGILFLGWNWKNVEKHDECTPPKSDIAPEGLVVGKTAFHFGFQPIFRGHVSFTEGTSQILR